MQFIMRFRHLSRVLPLPNTGKTPIAFIIFEYTFGEQIITMYPNKTLHPAMPGDADERRKDFLFRRLEAFADYLDNGQYSLRQEYPEHFGWVMENRHKSICDVQEEIYRMIGSRKSL